MLFALVFAVVGSSAELPHEQIAQAYYASYEHEKSQNYTEAIKAMDPVYQAYPKGYTVNYRLGWLTYLNGNFANALVYYKTALSIYPASVEVMNCISLVHKARMEWTKVETQNYSIIKIDYFNQTANYWYAYALRQQKKFDQAENVCRKMLTVFPTSVLFLNELGEVLVCKKEMAKATEIFSSVTILDPGNETAKKYMNSLTDNK
jgi:tetratricopeptide (TPR) repeat protein